MAKPEPEKPVIKCNKSPNLFCFLCALFVGSNSYPLSAINRSLYQDCYKVDVLRNGADKFYSPCKLCSSCVTNMREHVNKKRPLKYSKPARWTPPNIAFKTHEQACYVCLSQSVRGLKFQTSYIWPDDCTHNLIPQFDSSNARRLQPSTCFCSTRTSFEWISIRISNVQCRWFVFNRRVIQRTEPIRPESSKRFGPRIVLVERTSGSTDFEPETAKAVDARLSSRFLCYSKPWAATVFWSVSRNSLSERRGWTF